MGILRHDASGETATLGSRTLVGRGPDCTLRVLDRRVSGEHAAIVWRDSEWVVRDLGSRNGTWVDGRRLAPGERTPLHLDSELSLGAAGLKWRLLDAGPPIAQAMRDDGAELRTAEDGVLLLPDDERPILSVYKDASGLWLCDGEQGTQPVRDRDTLVAGDHRWRLHLPTALDPTVELTPTHDSLSLVFRVSADEEYVEIDLVDDGIRHELGVFAANYLLLTLARRRVQDADEPEAEQGWVTQDSLADMLRIDPNTVNVQVHRARQRASACNDRFAERLVERRRGTRQLRLGIGDVTIERL